MEVMPPEIEVMKAWMAVASDYHKLAVGALILPIVFLRNLLGVPEGEALYPYINKYLYISWGLLFSSVGLGMLYHATATCIVAEHLVDIGAPACALPAQIVFRFFTGSFILGIGFFLIGVLTAFRNATSLSK